MWFKNAMERLIYNCSYAIPRRTNFYGAAQKCAIFLESFDVLLRSFFLFDFNRPPSKGKRVNPIQSLPELLDVCGGRSAVLRRMVTPEVSESQFEEVSPTV